MLRAGDLVSAYEDAFAAWESGGDDKLWEAAVADGLTMRRGDPASPISIRASAPRHRSRDRLSWSATTARTSLRNVLVVVW